MQPRPRPAGDHRLPRLPRRRSRRGGDELVCQGCGLAYPVRDDIPVLLVDEARKPELRTMATWFDESRLDDEAALAPPTAAADAGRVRRAGTP